MKILNFTLGALMLCGSVVAQSTFIEPMQEVPAASPALMNQLKAIKLSKDGGTKITQDNGFDKTSGEVDTMRLHFDRCIENAVYYTEKNADFDGYWAGTMNNPIPLQGGDSIYILQHGLTFSLDVGRDRVAKLLGVKLRFAPGTSVVGEGDLFTINVWRKNEPEPGNIVLQPQRNFVQPFSIDDMELWDLVDQPVEHYIPLNDVEDKIINFADAYISILTKAFYNDDTESDDIMNFVFTQPNVDCDPENSNDWLVIAAYSNKEGGFYANYPDWLGQDFDVFGLFPVVDYVSGVDYNKPFAKMGGTELFGNFPNPATDQTTIKFAIQKSTDVTIRVSDMSGKDIWTSGPMFFTKGTHEFILDTSNLSCGNYIYTVESNIGSLGSKLSIEK